MGATTCTNTAVSRAWPDFCSAIVRMPLHGLTPDRSLQITRMVLSDKHLRHATCPKKRASRHPKRDDERFEIRNPDLRSTAATHTLRS